MIVPHCMKKEGLRGRVGAIVTAILFIVLIGITGFAFYYNSKRYSTDLITQDLKLLHEIFVRIDTECKILSFDYQKNPINFLNVGSFEGSEVGPMNLAYPTKWQGPYVKDNPTQQGLEYQIVRTHKGYFITPGDGVMLPNGKTVGKDIVLDEKADIPTLLQENGALQFKGTALAVELPLKTGTWQRVIQELATEQIEALVGAHDTHAYGTC